MKNKDHRYSVIFIFGFYKLGSIWKRSGESAVCLVINLAINSL